MSFKQISNNGYSFLTQYPRNNKYWKLASKATIAAVGVWSKLTLDAISKPKMHNMDVLFEAYRTSRLEKRGLLTIMNHTSVLDEPLVWGMLPYRQYFKKDGVRWALGADNVCFSNKFTRLFFSLGQVLATKRFGAGPFQGSIDAAINLLSANQKRYSAMSESVVDKKRLDALEDSSSSKSVVSDPAWVHIFPETFVHQPYAPHENTLKYFHWGVSRLILESTQPPIIVPIYTHGLEKIVPEDEGYLNKLRSRLGTEVEFNIGLPLDEKAIAAFREEWLNLVKAQHEKGDIAVAPNTAETNHHIYDSLDDELMTGQAAQELRSRVARFARQGVENSRVQLGFTPENPKFADHDFWKDQSEIRLAGKMHQRS